jgi:hypothetical protein
LEPYRSKFKTRSRRKAFGKAAPRRAGLPAPTPQTTPREFEAMRLEPKPTYRRIIVPWYDSDKACWGVLGFALAVLLFALAGLIEAFSWPSYHAYFWLPLLLVLLSSWVFFSILLRLVRRYTTRPPR